jgi:hypothetical protein
MHVRYPFEPQFAGPSPSLLRKSRKQMSAGRRSGVDRANIAPWDWTFHRGEERVSPEEPGPVKCGWVLFGAES